MIDSRVNCLLLLCFLFGCGDPNGPSLQMPPSPAGRSQPASSPQPPWQAVVDPASSAPQLPNSAVFPYELPRSTKVTFSRGSTRFVAASTPTPGTVNKAEIGVIDLQTGKETCHLSGIELTRVDRVVLSDDGKLLAINRHPDRAIRIWSTESGELIEERVLSEDLGINQLGLPSWFEILPSGELVAMRGAGETVVYVWTPGQTEAPRAFKLFQRNRRDFLRREAVAISPGGKYLAAVVGNSLVAHDLATGACAGGVEFQEEILARAGWCDRLQFSPDGKEVAGVMIPQGGDVKPGVLLCWDWATGELVSHYPISADVISASRTKARPPDCPRPWLQWLPDRSGWVLFGRVVWPREGTEPLETLPVDEVCPTRLLSRSEFLLCRENRQTRQTDLVYQGAPLPMDLVDTPRHGEAAPVEEVAWAAQVDPPEKTPTYPQANCFPLLIPGNAKLHYAAIPNSQVILTSEVPRNDGLRTQLDCLDLPAGEVVSSRLHYQHLLPDAFVFSNDDRQVYIHERPGSFVIANATNAPKGQGELSIGGLSGDTAQWLGLIAGEVGISLHVGTVQAEMRLNWLPGRQGPEKFSLAGAGLGSLPLKGACVLSPGGRYVAALVGKQLVIHELQSGNCVGTAAMEDGMAPEGIREGSLFFSPDGDEIVALLRGGDGVDRLLTWNAATGESSGVWFVARSDWEAEHGGIDLLAYEGPAVEWLPDESGWLLDGHIVVPREESAEVLHFPPTGDMTPRHLISASQAIVRSPVAQEVAALTLLNRGQDKALLVTEENAIASAGVSWPRDTKPERYWNAQPDGSDYAVRAMAQEIALPDGRPGETRFSATPSPYAVAGSRKRLYVVSVAEAAVKNELDLPEGTTCVPSDVSPDGKYVITTETKEEKRARVWDVAAGRAIFQFPLDRPPTVLRFLPNDRLLVAVYPPHLRVVQFLDSKILLDHQPGETPRLTNMACTVSPGGRYMALVSNNRLLLFDLSEGKFVGEVPFAEGDPRGWTALRMAFRLDGSRLYAVLRAPGDAARLLAWNMADGELVRDVMLEPEVAARVCDHTVGWRQPGWVPNDAPYLLAGSCVIDGETGRSIPLDVEPEPRVVSVVGVGRAIMSHRGKSGTFGRDQVMTCLLSPVQLANPVAAQLLAAVERHPLQNPHAADYATEAAPAMWDVAVDPAPPGTWEPSENLRIPILSSTPPLLGNRPSPYVCVASSKWERIALHDLKSGKLVGEADAGLQSIRDLAIRGDGKFVFLMATHSVALANLESGQTMPLAIENDFCLLATFDGEGMATLLTETNHQLVLRRFDPAAGTTLSETALAEGKLPTIYDYNTTGRTVSPGGRYLAVQLGRTVRVYETATGRLAGRMSWPYRGTHDNREGCLGMAFSRDGARLAALANPLAGNSELAVWDMANGQLVQYRRYGTRLNDTRLGVSQQAETLTWFSDRQGLLFLGNLLLDAETGAPVWRIDTKSAETLLPLSVQARLVATTRGKQFVAVNALPQAAPKAFQAVRGSRSERMPDLCQHDASSVKSVALWESPNPWQPTAAEPLDETARSLTIPDTSGQDVSCFRVLPGLKRVVVNRQKHSASDWLRRSAVGPIPSEKTNALETLDLASGRSLGKFEVPGPFVLLAVSSDGALYLTGERVHPNHSVYSRLDIWDSTNGNHLVGWQPVPKSAPLEELVSSARFCGKRIVLVQQKNRVTAWQVPECRLLYSVGSFSRAVVDPGEKYLLAGDSVGGSESGRYFPVREVATGGIVKRLVQPQQYMRLRPDAMAFLPDGRRAVALLRPTIANYQRLLVWDIESGNLLNDLPLPNLAAGDLHPLDERHVLASVGVPGKDKLQYLIDVEEERIRLAYEGDWPAKERVAHQLWRIDGNRLRAQSLLASATQQRGWKIAPNLAPGTSVAFEFKSPVAAHEQFRKTAKKKIQDLGWKTTGGNVRVQFLVSQVNKTGASDNLGRRIDRRARRYQVRILGPGGQELFEQHGDLTIGATGVVQGGSATFNLIDDDTEFITTWFERLKIPAVIFQKDWAEQIPKRPLP